MLTQLYYGPREAQAFPLARVDSLIEAARSAAGVSALMIWPCADPVALEHLVHSCLSCQIEPYLWFPVLADVPGVTPAAEELVVAFDGSRGNGRLGAWPGLQTGDEKFLFACPNRESFVHRSLGLFESLLDRFPFQGAMLDRIRFPSPANGFEMLFSCFCDACRRRYESQTGKSLSAQADLAASRAASAGLPWLAPELAELFSFRSRSVSRVAGVFSGEARRRGLKVGLDLFTPSLAPAVSQDYAALARLCDWIKPMIYIHARGPAGLPLESESLAGALHRDGPRAGDFPPETIGREMDLIDAMALPAGVDVLAGIEAVKLPQFAVDVSDKDLEEALSRVRGRCPGLVASWNLLAIPPANLRVLGRMAA